MYGDGAGPAGTLARPSVPIRSSPDGGPLMPETVPHSVPMVRCLVGHPLVEGFSDPDAPFPPPFVHRFDGGLPPICSLLLEQFWRENPDALCILPWEDE